MSTDKKEIDFRVDETFRPPEEADYNEIGLVQKLQHNQAGGRLVWNVMYLSHSDAGSEGAEETEDVTFLRLLCRGESAQKVQVQIKMYADGEILAWCDYIRTNSTWMAVLPEAKPAEPPWNVYGVPIEMGSFIFGENVKPKSKEGKALDYTFTASGGEIPKSFFRSLLGFSSGQA